ncbi:hypothetical protein [Halomarina oriensis]|uniref:Uncharacterized protein n=1 Tax=Halomarina oriensis TaxID=671145 RepID=A0A6B0GTQ3_9EURY|nr:hypothetical protein [Halomarina oriensis]MWG35098.1 hypothetical protein [Halomarina oriensis]
MTAGTLPASALAVPIAISPTLWVPVAMLGGFFAALVMDLPMGRLDEGSTPPLVAAGVLYDEPPNSLRPEQARSVHYTAGILAGVLYALVALVLDAVVPAVVTVAEVPLVSHLLAGAFVGLFLYSFFARGVLPRYGGGKRAVAATVRRSWAVSVGVFVVALLLFVPAFSFLLA